MRCMNGMSRKVHWEESVVAWGVEVRRRWREAVLDLRIRDDAEFFV